jgi:23S rRNA (guanosine2251-2'-O)-methyltransferase
MPEIIAGRKPVIEALRSDREIERIAILQGTQGTVIEEIRNAARVRGVTVVEMARQDFRAIESDAMTQGVVAIMPERKRTVAVQEIIDRARTSGEKPLLLILDEIEDPHNLGALIRTAEGAGVHGVIIPRHRSAPLTATVVKASAGATEHMPVAEVTNIVQTIEWLKSECGVWIVGLAMEGDRDFTAVDYADAVAIVVGNEGKGIRRLVREHCDFLVRIPMRGKVGSLNASVSGGIVLYEAVRQRTPPKT